MHPKLSKSPLTYVLIQVKFTSVENIEEYTPKLQDKIRGLFPHFQPVNYQGVQFKAGQAVNAGTFKQWHFLDKAKQTGIVLDKESLTIQTSRYDQFQPLLEKFKCVLVKFHEVVEFTLFTRLGLRYINLIEEGIADLNPALQGFQLTGHAFKENQFLTKTDTTQYSQEGVMKIQATHIGDKQVIGNAQNIFIPPDLAEIGKQLAFDEHNKPNGDFLLLDLDHFNADQDDFDVNTILDRLQGLHEVIYQSFCQAIGKKNLTNWSQ